MMQRVLGLVLILVTLIGALVFAMSWVKEPKNPWGEPFYSVEKMNLQKSYLKNEYFTGVDATKNYYSSFFKPENTIENPLILITGVEDITENWWDTVQLAFEAGFQKVYIYELRGQGRSQRVPGNKVRAIHVQKFEDYEDDLVLFLKSLQEKNGNPKKPPLVIAHSTGSLVFNATYPKIKQEVPTYAPKKAVHWAPFVKLNVSPFLNNPFMTTALSVLDRVANQLGFLILGKRFPANSFAENHITNNKEKYEWSETLRFKEKQNSWGVSIRWALEALRVGEKLYLDSYSKIDIPTLIFKAEDDQVVFNNYEIKNPHFSIKQVPNAKHALHIETPKILKELTSQSFQFLLN